MEFNKLAQIVEKHAREQQEADPTFDSDISAIVDAFHTRFADIKINSVSDIFDLCPQVDKKLGLSRKKGPLRVICDKARNAILHSAIDGFYEEIAGSTQYADLPGHLGIRRERDLAKVLVDAIPEIRMKLSADTAGEPGFDQHWLQMELNGSGVFERIRDLITDPDSKAQNWELFAGMLPQDLRGRFKINTAGLRDKEIAHLIQQYKSLIEKLGVEAVAQFLISTGRVKVKFTRLVRIISEYLGRFKRYDVSPSDLVTMPDQLLELTEINRLVFILLRNHIYRELMNDGYEDRPMESYAARLGSMKSKIQAELQSKLDVTQTKQKDLFERIMKYYDEVLEMEIPENMVSTIERKDGTFVPFPSLRQRIAMKELADGNKDFIQDEDGKETEVCTGHRKLIEFFMGLGKTATSFLCKEHVKSKKMLYISLTNTVDEVENEIKRVYKNGKTPTVGKIVADMKPQERLEALQAEIVIVPYSMLREEIVSQLKETSFDFMAVDEVQWARNPDGAYTDAVHQLINGIPDLYEEGYILTMSGDSTPNGPKDIVPQLRIADRNRYGNITSLISAIKNQDPLVVRNVLMDYRIVLDPPENWEEKYVENVIFNLYEEEFKIYQSILLNSNLTATQKLQQLSLCILNPSLFAAGKEIPSSLLDQAIARLEQWFEEGYEAAVVSENMFKHGVTREHRQYVADAVAKKLKEHFSKKGEEVDVLVFDGNSKPPERRKIIEMSKRKGKKTIVFAISGTIKEGTNEFAHIHRSVILGPNFNKADTSQLVKRFARGGNIDVKVAVLMADGTVQQGITEHADYKYGLTQLVKYGGVFTEDDLNYLKDANIAESVRIIDNKLYIGTAIMNHLMTPRQNLARLFAKLQNKGVDYIKEVFVQFGKLIAEIYTENWESSYSGNNARFITALLMRLETENLVNGHVYADLACGPLVLDRSFDLYDESASERTVYSLDLNPHMVDFGLQLKDPLAKKQPKPAVGTFTKMDYEDDKFDVLNCALAYEYTKVSERSKTLCEFNRVLKTGGIALITMPVNVCTPEEFEKFKEVISRFFGFEILEDYTGIAESTDNSHDYFRNFTVVCRKTGQPDLAGLNLDDLIFTRQVKTTHGKSKDKDLKTPNEHRGFVHMNFAINDRNVGIDGTSPVKEQQDAYYLEVIAAEDVLRKIYSQNENSFDNLPVEVFEELKAKGILLTNILEKVETSAARAKAGSKAALNAGSTADSKAGSEAGSQGSKTDKKQQYRKRYLFTLVSDKSTIPKSFYLNF